jgi:hypothetical protein
MQGGHRSSSGLSVAPTPSCDGPTWRVAQPEVTAVSLRGRSGASRINAALCTAAYNGQGDRRRKQLIIIPIRLRVSHRQADCRPDQTPGRAMDGSKPPPSQNIEQALTYATTHLLPLLSASGQYQTTLSMRRAWATSRA